MRKQKSPAQGQEDFAMPAIKFVIAMLLGCTASSTLAENSQSENPPLRYSFQRVDDGFLRLDNVSGQVSYCSAHAVGWACQAVPEDRAALEKEIARLQEQVASLTSQLATLREPRPPADMAPAPKSDEAKQLREDLERARVAIENAWRRLVEMLVNFQKDMMRKS
jgi:hypothetical protein